MEIINIGILTAGGIADKMAETIGRMKGVRVLAVAARNPDRAAAFAKKHGIARAYGSYEELVKDPEIDLVYVGSPHSHHYEHVKLCLTYGKNVLCEKAFTVNAAQAEELIRMAEAKGVLLAEALWVRYMPMTLKLKELLETGVIGKAAMVTANLHYPLRHIERMVKPELAGGALLDLGVYVLNFAAIVLGDEVERVAAQAVMTPEGVDLNSAYTLIYKDGSMAVLNSGFQAASDRRGTVYGEKGYIVVENINNFESITVYDLNYQETARYLQEEQISGYEYEVESCKNAIHEGLLECPQMPLDETLRIMRLMDTIREQIGLKYPCE